VSFRSQVVGPIPPTLAAIVAGVDAASNSAAAAANSAIARIRSMTRVAFAESFPVLSDSLAISVANINRCQVHTVASYVTQDTVGDQTALFTFNITGLTNTSISIARMKSGVDAAGYIEVMEWL
jgi:hypothetical protein